MRPAKNSGSHLGRAREGQKRHVHPEATKKPEPAPSNCGKNLPQQKQNSGHESAETNLDSTSADSTPLATSSPISSASKRNSSSNWMGFLRSQHLEQQEYDEERTKYLNSLGYKVVRFWNTDVMKNMDGVLLAIIQAMEDESKIE